MKIYLVRHGETAWNKFSKIQGQTDVPLNEEGIRLAKISGENMVHIPFDYIISSPLIRAVETAKLITNGRLIPFITDDRIKEISFGLWEGACILEENEVTLNYLPFFRNDPFHAPKPPEGETFQDVCKRTGDFFHDLLSNPDYENASILISTHGATGRCLLSHFLQEKEDIWQGGVPKNCSVCILDIKNGVANLIEKDKLFYE